MTKVPVKKVDKNLTEKQVKESVVRYLKKKGWEVFTVYLGGIPCGFGRLAPNPLKGFPDLICTNITSGAIIYIELKRTKGGKLSPEQIEWHARLRKCLQIVHVINSIEVLKEII